MSPKRIAVFAFLAVAILGIGLAVAARHGIKRAWKSAELAIDEVGSRRVFGNCKVTYEEDGDPALEAGGQIVILPEKYPPMKWSAEPLRGRIVGLWTDGRILIAESVTSKGIVTQTLVESDGTPVQHFSGRNQLLQAVARRGLLAFPTLQSPRDFILDGDN